MVEPATERAKKVVALATRLKALHSELRGEEAALRSEQLQDEVNRALQGVQPHERERFLQELLIEFPTWSSEGQAAPVVQASTQEAVVDPGVLVEKLAEAARSMSAADKARIIEKLASVGLVKKEVAPASGGSGMPDTVTAGLRKAVGAGTDSTFMPERMAELLTISAEYMIRVESMSTTFAREIGVEGKYAAFTGQTLKKETPRFLAGDPKATREVMAKAEERNRILIAAVVRAVRDAGDKFATDHLARFRPEEIERAVGSVTFGKPARCWDTYCSMMKAVDKTSMTRRVQELVRKEIEVWLDQFVT